MVKSVPLRPFVALPFVGASAAPELPMHLIACRAMAYCSGYLERRSGTVAAAIVWLG